MSTFDVLLDHFRERVAVPWRDDVPAAGRVWILWYDKSLERRVRGRLAEFELVATAAGKGWRHFDVAPLFGEWMAQHPWLERLAKRPSQIERVIPDFEAHLVALLRAELAACAGNDLLAVTGIASLFGLTRASTLIAQVASAIPGRMMVAFPGTHANGIYRLLDARDGWNYLAVPIPSADVA